ncbi:MAG: fluoride efflux transporter CrcB [Pseudomonadota bacterium]|jgi:CrcB protein
MGLNGLLAVGAGAAIGAWLRWWLGILLNPLFPTLPLGTLAANIGGGYLMGLAMAIFANHPGLSPEVRLLLATGFLGGLTTFSTFSAETVALLLRQQWGWAAAIISAHVVGSLAATLAGIWTVNLLKS